MPRGDKSSYTSKQKRQAEHIEKGYKKRGVSTKEAEKRAWATVNKTTPAAKKAVPGAGKRTTAAPRVKAVVRPVAPNTLEPRAGRKRRPTPTHRRNAHAGGVSTHGIPLEVET